tara:strand:- start:1197 stop:1373 length:177 start_codon:yes stop_codon:yes gene_type:complete
MGKMKAWLMDMEEQVGNAFESGAKTEQDVISYCKHHMELPIDEQYIKQTWKIYTGENP